MRTGWHSFGFIAFARRSLMLSRSSGRDPDPMASAWVQSFLALEVTVQGWSAACPRGGPQSDPRDEPGEWVVGCTADRRELSSLKSRSPNRLSQVHDQKAPGGRVSWATFLRNHTDGIAAADLFVVPTIGSSCSMAW